MRKHSIIVLLLALVLLMNLSSVIPVSVAAPGDDAHQISSLGLTVVAPRQEPKEKSNIDSVILRVLQDLEARGVTRDNANAIEVSSLSIEGVLQIDDDGNIQTYILLSEAGAEQANELVRLETQLEIARSDLNVIQAWVPFDRIRQISEFDFVKRIQLPDYAHTWTGSVNTEGDAILRANLVRNLRGITGNGIRVGVISDGVNSRAVAQASGDLPNNIEIDPGRPGNGDEGTAMLEIVHDLAPNAQLAFSGPSTSLEMVNSINFLASQAFGGAGADIIVDDLGLFAQPYFEDGFIAETVENVIANGTIYASSAGNSGDAHYESDFVRDPLDFHNFGGGDNAMRVLVGGGGTIRMFLQWTDPFGASGVDYDLWTCVAGFTPGTGVPGQDCFASNFEQDGDDDPIEGLSLTNNGPNTAELDIFIDGFFATDIRRLELFVLGNILVTEFNVPGGSLFGHAAVPGAYASAAIDASDPGNNDIEPFSSQGPADIFFPSFESRPKPDITAIDGVSVTGAGGFPGTFFGTSAASPHVAGIAALVLEAVRNANPGISKTEAADQVRQAIMNTAVDLGTGGFDEVFGAGRIDSLAAVDEAVSADLSVTKSVDNTAPNEGDNIVYTVTVNNAGPDNATGVQVTDVLPTGVTYVSDDGDGTYDSNTGVWNVGDVASGESDTLRITATVDAGTGGQTITNTASVTSADQIDLNPDNNSDSADITVQVADLSILKDVNDTTPDEGDDIMYTVIASNSGPDNATGVQVTDMLPTGVTYVSDDSGGTYDSSTGVWNVGDVASGESDTLRITATVDSGTGGQTITNTARVTSADQIDLNPDNNSDSADITVQVADLSILKDVNDTTPDEGDNIMYTVIVSNAGPDDATGVQVTDMLPTAVTYVSDDGGGTYDSSTGVWNVGDVASGESDTLRITATVDSGTGGQTITNTASVTSADQADLNPDNNSDTKGMTVSTKANLSVTKAGNPDPVIAGEQLTYTITVTNGGPSDATGVTVTDTLPAEVDFDSDIASQGSFDKTTGVWTVGNLTSDQVETLIIVVNVSVSTADGTTLTNTATVSGNETDPDDTNDSAVVDTAVLAEADLSITKLADPNPVVAGEQLVYTVTVTNGGPSRATRVKVFDTLPEDVTFVSASQDCNETGGTVTCDIGRLAVGKSEEVSILVDVNLSATSGPTSLK